MTAGTQGSAALVSADDLPYICRRQFGRGAQAAGLRGSEPALCGFASMFKARQRFGKYIIERRLGEGGFAVVYQARDTIEGIRVALKVPYQHLVSGGTIETFRHEVRVAAQLEHPNILPLKYADFIEGRFVIVTALGQMTLDQRLQKRISVDTALNYTEQMLAAVAHAHEHRIIHCDIKPDNFLLFPGNRLKLTDFGIARFAQRTLRGSGAGTVGYIAPEQAMGQAVVSLRRVLVGTRHLSHADGLSSGVAF